MPFIMYRAKRAVMSPNVMTQVARLVRIRKHGIDNLTILDVYQIADDEPKEVFNRNGTLVVLLRANGGVTKFMHLSGRDIKHLLDAFHPTFHPDMHSLRIDDRLTIDKEYDTPYDRY